MSMARPEVTGKGIQRWYTKSQLAARYSTCERTIERWVLAGQFPAGIRMPPDGKWYRWYWSDATIADYESRLIRDVQIRESTEAPASTAA
jgi:hypothetical protein